MTLKDLFKKKKKNGDTYHVILKDGGRQKIRTVETVRAITGCGIDEATHLVANAPKIILSNVTAEQAENAKMRLEAVEANVVIE